MWKALHVIELMILPKALFLVLVCGLILASAIFLFLEIKVVAILYYIFSGRKEDAPKKLDQVDVDRDESVVEQKSISNKLSSVVAVSYIIQVACLIYVVVTSQMGEGTVVLLVGSGVVWIFSLGFVAYGLGRRWLVWVAVGIATWPYFGYLIITPIVLYHTKAARQPGTAHMNAAQ